MRQRRPGDELAAGLLERIPMKHWPRHFLSSALLTCLVAASGASAARAEDLSTSSGEQLFQRYCASCHGRGGAGDGPVAPFFKLLPPDLTGMSRRSGGKFPAARARQIIDGRERILPHGARQMPVWGQEFELTADEPVAARAASEAAITKLVEYLQSIQKLPK
jgi:mono/diheme cytochrome c family protein